MSTSSRIVRLLSAAPRPRVPGVVFAVITVLVALAAANTGASLLYLVVGGLLSFLVLSLGFAGVGLGRLRVTLEAPQAVTRGESFGMTARIENLRRLMPALCVRVEKASSRWSPEGYVLRIPPRAAAALRISCVYDRRGVFPLPPVALSSAFPFGLISKRRRADQRGEIVVYPRVRAVRAAVIDQFSAALAAPRLNMGEGDEFFCLREYLPGDDLRRIAWRASARRGTLLVKELAQEAPRYVVFVLDTFRSDDGAEFDARFEEAIELVASLAVTLLHRQYTVAVASASGCASEGKGKAQVTRVLDLLARVNPGTENYPPSVQAFALARANEARLIFVSPDPESWGRRSAFGNSWVLDPREVVCA